MGCEGKEVILSRPSFQPSALATMGVLAVSVGVLTVSRVGAAVVVTAVALLIGIRANRPWHETFLGVLLMLLLGLLFLGRNFAGISVGPIFLTDVVMLLGIITLPTLRLRPLGRVTNEVFIALCVFVGWNCLLLVRDLPRHGLDAARDATIWGYVGFALIVALAVQPNHLRRLLQTIQVITVPLIVSSVAILVARAIVPDLILRIPGSDVPSIFGKSGDFAVHLGGLGAFIALGVTRVAGISPPKLSAPLFWMLWTIAFLIVASTSRGAALAALSAIAVTALVSRGRSILGVSLVAAVVILFLLTLQVGIATGYRGFSLENVGLNLLSVVNPEAEAGRAATVEWRLDWWTTIIDYTFNGPYFLGGKGYGINLATDDGFASRDPDRPLRSPHSIHFNYLARSGVPGLGLWLLVQVLFLRHIWRGLRNARVHQNGRHLALNGWILAYWTAFMVNASFDVYLESPQGGAPFWCLIGLGLALPAISEESIGNSTKIDEARGKRQEVSQDGTGGVLTASS